MLVKREETAEKQELAANRIDCERVDVLSFLVSETGDDFGRT